MKVSLKSLILSVALLAIFATLATSITAGYRVNQQSLIDTTLETNRVYAQKLATTTEDYINGSLLNLKFSASKIEGYLEETNAEALIVTEADRLREYSDSFNSVVIVSSNEDIMGISPEALLDKIGKHIESPGSKQALKEKKPLISQPYISATGNLLVFISYPIFDGVGNYQGYIGGSIYLLQENLLHKILGEHFYNDGSYVYVVDEDGRLLYHPDKKRIGETVLENPVIAEIRKGKSGARRLINRNNIDMLAGYSYIPLTKWGVVSQRPAEAALEPSRHMINEMMKQTLPFLLLSFVLIIIISNLIASPLKKLTLYANSTMKNNEIKKVDNVRAWYFEAIQLENALINSFVFFQDKVNYFIHESTTDPLTGLVNRRTMDEQTKQWIETKTPFSIILLDIDFFKRVNDTYGHSVGDEVLIFLAEEMRRIAGEENTCCRYGGEEFIILLPNKTKFEAFDVAERLRTFLEETVSPSGEIITISSGIASYPDCAAHTVMIIEAADKSLYEAKNSGRNKSIITADK